MFDDLLDANQRYQNEFHDSGVQGKAAKGLAVLTCIDSRIDPLAMLGLRPRRRQDHPQRRRARHRRCAALARAGRQPARRHRVCVVQHTDCAMIGSTDDELRERISELRGVDASGWEFLASTDQLATLHADIRRVEACALLPPDLEVGAFIFDVHNGELVAADERRDE